MPFGDVGSLGGRVALPELAQGCHVNVLALTVLETTRMSLHHPTTQSSLKRLIITSTSAHKDSMRVRDVPSISLTRFVSIPLPTVQLINFSATMYREKKKKNQFSVATNETHDTLTGHYFNKMVYRTKIAECLESFRNILIFSVYIVQEVQHRLILLGIRHS